MTAPTLPGKDEIREAAQAARAEAAGAFGRAFDGEFELVVGEASLVGSNNLVSILNGPGLIFVFSGNHCNALAVLPESSALVPEWCAKPDPAGQSKLKTLAMELGAAIIPESMAPADCQVVWVSDLAAGIQRAELAEDCACVSMTLSRGGKSGSFSLIWPAAKCQAAIEVGEAEAGELPVTEAMAAHAEGFEGSHRPPIHCRDIESGLHLLPAYSRSLLKIPVPVTVILAESKQSLQTIVNIGPGSIIHFNKSCEDTLTLEVAGHRFAVGETVKVGDKFGLWITSIILPEERFWVIGSRKPVTRAK